MSLLLSMEILRTLNLKAKRRSRLPKKKGHKMTNCNIILDTERQTRQGPWDSEAMYPAKWR